MKIPTSALFAGVGTHDIDSMMSCLSAKERNYKKNEFIFHTGDKVTQIGMVLEGTVHMMKEDVWGECHDLRRSMPWRLIWRSLCLCRSQIFRSRCCRKNRRKSVIFRYSESTDSMFKWL